LKPLSPAARTVAQFVFAFGCVFGGLALPSPGIGPAYTRLHAALGNALVSDASFERGLTLHFEAADADLALHPWQLTLHVRDPQRIEQPSP
jgi:hypothetical protein